jgi:dephospho-CoA kinase
MANQTPRAERIKQADDILSNQGSGKELEKHAQELHQHYLTARPKREGQ